MVYNSLAEYMNNALHSITFYPAIMNGIPREQNLRQGQSCCQRVFLPSALVVVVVLLRVGGAPGEQLGGRLPAVLELEAQQQNTACLCCGPARKGAAAAAGRRRRINWRSCRPTTSDKRGGRSGRSGASSCSRPGSFFASPPTSSFPPPPPASGSRTKRRGKLSTRCFPRHQPAPRRSSPSRWPPGRRRRRWKGSRTAKREDGAKTWKAKKGEKKRLVISVQHWEEEPPCEEHRLVLAGGGRRPDGRMPWCWW